MDISPLPHKLPYRSNVEIHLQSPTPELIPADISDPSIFSPSLAAPKEPTKFILPQEYVEVGQNSGDLLIIS